MTQNQLISVTIVLSCGEVLKLSCSSSDFQVFHKNMEKYHEGLKARTTSYKMTVLGNHAIVHKYVASYFAQDMNGSAVVPHS